MAGAPERRLRRLLLAFWVLPAIVGTVGFLLVPSRLNPELSVVRLLLMQLTMWGSWVVWTALLWLIGDRLAARRASILLQAMVYGVCGVGVVLLQILWQASVATTAGISEARSVDSTIVIGLRTNGDYFVVIYAALVLAQSAIRWLATLQAERLAAAQLGTDLARAQLQALRTQLQPHFLFNALNAIVTLIARDQQAAQRTTVQVADLLRLSLRAGEQQEVPLTQELEITRRYLEIEQLRFQDRLAVHWYVHASDEVWVPAFALQPLVENALVHGIARSVHGGRITITVSGVADDVLLQVHNSGPGLWPPSTASGTGTALTNLRARLERLYGTAASLRLHDDSGDGVTATLRLPRRSAGDHGIRSNTVGAGAVSTPASNAVHDELAT